MRLPNGKFSNDHATNDHANKRAHVVCMRISMLMMSMSNGRHADAHANERAHVVGMLMSVPMRWAC